MKTIRKRLILFAAIFLSSTAVAEDEGGDVLTLSIGKSFNTRLCPQSLGIPERPDVDAVLEFDDTYLVGNEADLIENGISTMTGDAEITRNTQQVKADFIRFDQPSDIADLDGNVHYWDEDVFLLSDEGFLTFDNGVGDFVNADYTLIESRGRGTADKLTLDVGTRTDLEQVEYSTCEPDDQFWKLDASSISLDHEENRGTGRNVWVKVKNIPIFYSPYLSFPLSKERKSGFLAPSYGTTKRNGIQFSRPYYWNISPNMDATLTPRFFSDSGVMGIGEYRYLHKRGSGEINLEYLPSDNNLEDRNRNLFGIELNQKFLAKGNLYLDYNRVSDRFYFEDFGDQLSSTSTRFLGQRADITYSGNNWNLLTRLQSFQTVDRTIAESSRPYKRLPQILFNYNSPRKNNVFNYGLNSEAVYFTRRQSDSFTTNVNGLRTDLNPYVSYRRTTDATFIEPKLRLRYTQYNLESNTSFDSNPNRLLPIFSLDSGVFFERDISLFGDSFLQTLEPRLFYLYIPNDDQSDLPVFDTGLYTFSFASLFREDRFSNPDRVGDANQLTLALTSRFINQKTGQNLGSISLGQIYFFRDREVNLPGRAILDESSSPFVAQFNTRIIKDFNISGDFQWDPNKSDGTEKLTAQVSYNPEPGKVLNMAYRIRRDSTDIEQSDISFRWPIGQNWSAVGRWNYAIPENRSLELFGGIAYESCCWGVRAVARRFLTDTNGTFENGIFLQFELKGLAGIGRKTVDFLKQQVPGYHSEF